MHMNSFSSGHTTSSGFPIDRNNLSNIYFMKFQHAISNVYIYIHVLTMFRGIQKQVIKLKVNLSPFDRIDIND